MEGCVGVLEGLLIVAYGVAVHLLVAQLHVFELGGGTSLGGEVGGGSLDDHAELHCAGQVDVREVNQRGQRPAQHIGGEGLHLSPSSRASVA